MEEAGGFKGRAREEMLNGEMIFINQYWHGGGKGSPKSEVRMSKADVADSKACEYGLFVARSSIGRGPGYWNSFDLFDFISRL